MSDTGLLDTEPSDEVIRSDRDSVATLTLNRADRYNPLSSSMVRALGVQVARIASDPKVRAVVIAGAGRGFCAGHDLRELRAHAGDVEWQRRLFDDCARFMVELTRLPQPVIARVHGIASAAGCQLVSMCDLAVASTEARFALPGVDIGLFCSTPAVGAARNIPRKPLMEMLLTGEPIDARTAMERGLLNQVVDAERLDEAVRRYTDQVCARSFAVIAAGKRAFYGQAELGMEDAYALASAAMRQNLESPDAAEGIDAFLEKRSPRWRA